MTEEKLDFLSSERIRCPKCHHGIIVNVYLKDSSFYLKRPKIYARAQS